ncbi:hypothetical protein HDU87_006376 [Geranomyces variabilis]|uniref:Transmembrane protein n=1 Tax=Geranomyces variabilis TaxID=109894 RepID=A0AAD5XQM5_9FUNG|nr:hypothetical protein HDU87_006376 [Geranomyces variabilis]
MSRNRNPARHAALPSDLRPADEPPLTPRSPAMRYLESAAWITLALAVAYYSNLAAKLQEYGFGIPFYLLFISLSGFVCVFIYLQFYVPSKTGVRVDLTKWETQARLPVQIATAFGTAACASSCVMLWPAYGFFTPVVVFVFFMGGLSFIGLF